MSNPGDNRDGQPREEDGRGDRNMSAQPPARGQMSSGQGLEGGNTSGHQDNESYLDLMIENLSLLKCERCK